MFVFCVCLLYYTIIRFATLHNYRSQLTSLRTNLNMFPFKMLTEYLSQERSKINLNAQKRSQERDSIVREQHVLEQEVTSFTVHHQC